VAADDIAGGYFSGTGQEADRPAKALWIDRLTFQNPLDVWIGARSACSPTRSSDHRGVSPDLPNPDAYDRDDAIAQARRLLHGAGLDLDELMRSDEERSAAPEAAPESPGAVNPQGADEPEPYNPRIADAIEPKLTDAELLAAFTEAQRLRHLQELGQRDRPRPDRDDDPPSRSDR